MHQGITELEWNFWSRVYPSSERTRDSSVRSLVTILITVAYFRSLRRSDGHGGARKNGGRVGSGIYLNHDGIHMRDNAASDRRSFRKRSSQAMLHGALRSRPTRSQRARASISSGTGVSQLHSELMVLIEARILLIGLLDFPRAICLSRLKERIETDADSFAITRGHLQSGPAVRRSPVVRSTRLPRDYCAVSIAVALSRRSISILYWLTHTHTHTHNLFPSLSPSFLSILLSRFVAACLVVRLYVTPFRTPSIGIQFMDVSNSDR